MEDLMNALPETDVLLELAITYGGKLLLALLTLIVGLWLIGKLTKSLKKLFKARDFDQTLQSFLSSLVGLTLKALLLISVISMVGVQMTDRKSTRLNSSHVRISYAVFCLKKKNMSTCHML